MKRIVILLALVALLLLGGSALAGMSSPDYRLDWLTLAGGGGGPAGSGSYAVNLTVGQAAIGAAAGTDYQACLGYWCGTAGPWRVYLPLLLRSG
jgi:hypothetical protein